MKWHFYNRLSVVFIDNCIHCKIYTIDLDEAEKLGEFSNISCEIFESETESMPYNYYVLWKSSDAIDLLNWLNKDTFIYNSYLAPLAPSNTLQCNFQKLSSNAITPTKAHPSDSGFDLTFIKLMKTVGDVQYFSSDIVVEPPHGYYFDLVARSSLSKTGYMLANAIGIIDQNYRGPIIIALRKVNKEAKDLELPAKIAQIIPKQWYNLTMKETNCSNTSRGEGGFGSTN